MNFMRGTLRKVRNLADFCSFASVSPRNSATRMDQSQELEKVKHSPRDSFSLRSFNSKLFNCRLKSEKVKKKSLKIKRGSQARLNINHTNQKGRQNENLRKRFDV